MGETGREEAQLSAKVRPEKWRETVNAHLDEANGLAWELRDTERPETRFRDANKIAADYLSAAHRVFAVTKTVAKAGSEWPWHEKWKEDRLSPEERDLWKKMNRLRANREHGEGAAIIQEPVLVGPSMNAAQQANGLVLGLTPAQMSGGIYKFTARFGPFKDKPGGDIAYQHLSLCRRFADDFERDHALPK
jgi:hypothetical protein